MSNEIHLIIIWHELQQIRFTLVNILSKPYVFIIKFLQRVQLWSNDPISTIIYSVKKIHLIIYIRQFFW